MCTIGAIRLDDNNIILFKNKDFADVGFNDKVVLNESYFGPLGLETFDLAGAESVFSGLSLGANKHGLMACVNHVKSTGDNALNYDLLVESVMKNCRDVDSAIEHINDLLSGSRYWWGNLVFADKHKTAVVEVRDSQCRVEIDEGKVFRTNHQPMFGEPKSPDNIECSALRYESTSKRLNNLSCIEDVLTMLSTHDSDNGETGICNHSSSLKTVYSYVLHLVDDQIHLYVCQGNPCESNWNKLLIPLGRYWSKASAEDCFRHYPTRH
jgi:predicted choloylglycine hydrolase